MIMDVQNKDFEIPLWYGSMDKDIISIQQWLDIVQEAKGICVQRLPL
jgi:hypothetical protein